MEGRFVSIWSVIRPELWCGQEDLNPRLQFLHWIEQAANDNWLHRFHLSFHRHHVYMLYWVRPCMCSYFSVCVHY